MKNQKIEQKALNLCYAIEDMPASVQQTKVSIIASELHDLIKANPLDALLGKALPSADVLLAEETTIKISGEFFGVIINTTLKATED